MKRKLVLAAALCLAAALSIGSAPALAADGCYCHTAATPDPTPSATPAHAPLVAGVSDCTTCHKGMTVVDASHPDLLVKPALTARYARGEFFGALIGGLSIPWVPLSGVTIYPQIKAADATVWYTLEPLFGGDRIATSAIGNWFCPVKAWPEGTALRAISQGFAGPPVVLPAISGPFKRPFPTLTLRLRGLKHGVAKRGHAVTARGKALPAELAGRKAFLRLQRSYPWPGGPHRLWRTVFKATRTIGTAGDFSKRFTPKARGQYRVRTFVDGTAAYRGVTTDWRRFRVR